VYIKVILFLSLDITYLLTCVPYILFTLKSSGKYT